ncbi:MAG: hypothetical protein Q9192_007833 [Flavoplaca navasiana]
MSATGSNFSFVGEGRMVKVKGSDSPVNQSESLLVERVGRVRGRSWVSRGGSWLADGKIYGGEWLNAGCNRARFERDTVSKDLGEDSSYFPWSSFLRVHSHALEVYLSFAPSTLRSGSKIESHALPVPSHPIPSSNEITPILAIHFYFIPLSCRQVTPYHPRRIRRFFARTITSHFFMSLPHHVAPFPQLALRE